MKTAKTILIVINIINVSVLAAGTILNPNIINKWPVWIMVGLLAIGFAFQILDTWAPGWQ